MDTKTIAVDEVIESRKLYEEADKRLIDLDDAMVGLESDEIKVRKEIDKLLADTSESGQIAYQMKSEQLAAIRSKIVYTRQSTGVARSALMDALSDYNLVLNQRTRKRKTELRANLIEQLPRMIESLSALAVDVLAYKSFIDGMPSGQLNLQRIISKSMDNQLGAEIEEAINKLKQQIEED